MPTSHAYCTEEITSYYSIWFSLLTGLPYLSLQLISHICQIWFRFIKEKWSFFKVALSALSHLHQKNKRNFEDMNCRSVLTDFNVLY